MPLNTDTTLIKCSRRQWRNQLGFPFATLSQVNACLLELSSKRDDLLLLCDSLIMEWKESALEKIVPVYLSRSTDKSLTVLRWRLRTMGKTLSRTQLDKELLSYFHIAGHYQLLFKFESRRQDLNYMTAMTLYEINRLTDYLDQTRELISLKNSNLATHKENQ